MQHIQATHASFAAILADGSVVTCGHPKYGGDSSAVQDQRRDVQHIQGTVGAFVAVLATGSIAKWGSPRAAVTVPQFSSVVLATLPFRSMLDQREETLSRWVW